MSLPRILGGRCEFCGQNAAACAHAAEFRKHGLLVDEATRSFMEKLKAPVPGLPRIIGDNCEFCGVHYLNEKCLHLKARRKAILGDEDAVDDTKVITKDTEQLLAEANAARELQKAKEDGAAPLTRSKLPPELGGDKEEEIKIEASAPADGGVVSSGDAEMDKIMDENENGNVNEVVADAVDAGANVGGETAPGLE